MAFTNLPTLATPGNARWRTHIQGALNALSALPSPVWRSARPTTHLDIALSKGLSREERELCQQAVAAAHTSFQQIEFVKITEEDRFFAIDDELPDEVPRRGTCIRLNKRITSLYTEGSEERQPWANRPPSAVTYPPLHRSTYRPTHSQRCWTSL